MFNAIEAAAAKPAVWSEYTADLLWTDRHVAQQMLALHLNPEIPAASRSFEFIDESVDWLMAEFNLNHDTRSIDFGCGPGLYTQRLKQRDVGTVVGVDFSENSLNYASEQATQAGLDIEYHLGNYLDYNDDRQFDLITMVMCDLCALNPAQRAQLLAKFKSLLVPNGVIALDVYAATRFNGLSESRELAKNSMGGFWAAEDYWCLQSSFLYQQELVSLDKYVIYQSGRERTVYNWLQHFTLEMLSEELAQQGLEIKASYSDLRGNPLTEGDEMAVVIGHQ